MNEPATPASPDRSDRWLLRAERISDAYGLVLLLTLTTFVVASIAPTTGWGRTLSVALLGLTSVVALTSSDVAIERVRVAVFVAVLATVAAAISSQADVRWPLGLAIIASSLLLLWAAMTILRRVLRSHDVDFRTILGSLSTYTMLGLLFGFLYVGIDILQHGDFFGQNSNPESGDFLFFSYTTLTTTGYGNLVPAGQPGETLAVFEMLVGQIYLVTLVAGLVSLWRPNSGQGESVFANLRKEMQEAGEAVADDESEPAGP